jgi:hypothetical protein
MEDLRYSLALCIINLGTGCVWWSLSCSTSFTPVGRALVTSWIGVWLNPRAGLDVVAKTKVLTLTVNRRPVV